MINSDKVFDKADTLARRCAGDKVPDNLLSAVLAHLRRHRNVEATLQLLRDLPVSCFANRTGSTRKQLTKLKLHVSDALRESPLDWEQAAWIVGWARRLARFHGSSERG